MPEAVAADLGIQLAGGVAVPVVEGDEAALPPLVRWLAVAGEGPPPEVSAPVVEPPASDDEAAAAAGILPRRLADETATGAALVRSGEGWETWTAGELCRAAGALADTGRGRQRPIVLVAGDLAAAAERAWLSWALSAGAALVLPGDPAFAAWAMFWPRPTDVCLPVEQLPAVRGLLATLGSARAQRRRLARLCRLLVWGGAPSAEESLAWQALGVTLTHPP